VKVEELRFMGIRIPPFLKGRLVRRYKRFLAEVRIGKDRIVTAHCPNTGSMLGCCQPGRPVWLSISTKRLRKYPYTWEFIEMPSSLVGINTYLPNRLVREALEKGKIEGLEGYCEIKSEIRTSRDARLDLMLSGKGLQECFVEIKNCTLVEDHVAMFPDAVTLRGQRHLRELASLAASGKRAVLFILVQRMDARCFRPADKIDPVYGRLLREAKATGVEIIVYDASVRPFMVELRAPLKVEL
jgi:sugar fermentation stimulation protein A